VNWHHHVPTEEELCEAMLELDEAEKALGAVNIYE
jgi:hypothetical protein